LHYQREPHGQAKMFRCVQGEVFDACVDVRKGRKIKKQVVTATYSAEDRRMMFVPKGFANAILSINDEDAIVIYTVEGYHVPEAETGLRWDDPALGIKWPVTPTLLSKKDQNWPLLKDIK
jgi:dTDP-4-dehydrorhamnose 3,5-epimerase